LSCLVLNAFADDSKNSALSALESFAPVASGINKAVASSTNTVMQTAKYLAQKRKEIDDISKDAIARMKEGKWLTREQRKVLELKSAYYNHNYRLTWGNIWDKIISNPKLTRCFWLEYRVYYNRDGKKFFAPKKSLKISKGFSGFTTEKEEQSSMNVEIEETKAKEEEILPGFKLPTEILVPISYYACGTKPHLVSVKYGKSLLRLFSSREKPTITKSSGDLSIKHWMYGYRDDKGIPD
jgi:hypothetical protein